MKESIYRQRISSGPANDLLPQELNTHLLRQRVPARIRRFKAHTKEPCPWNATHVKTVSEQTWMEQVIHAHGSSSFPCSLCSSGTSARIVLMRV